MGLSIGGDGDSLPTHDHTGSDEGGLIESLGIWSKYGNSPKTESGVTSSTYNISSSKDEFIVFVSILDKAGTGTNVSLQANGDTGANYTAIERDGSEVSGLQSVQELIQMSPNEESRMQLSVAGRWGVFWGAEKSRPQYLGSNNTVSGFNDNISSPLSSLTFDRGTDAFDITWKVYGRE
jgi:hypothetical protein